MSIASRLHSAGKKVTSVVAATAVTATLMVVGAGTAEAANRDWLRPDATGACEWDASGHWVQRCDVWSPAMDRTVPVLVQPAQRGGDAGFYLLDGMRADPHQTGWTMFSDAQVTYEDSNINLIMPIGGAGTFYADWVDPGNTFSSSDPQVIKWETFLTAELPGYLQQHFGVNPNRNSIAGLSMGGTAALNIAARHPEMYQQAMSFSGYLTTTAPGMQTMIRFALLETGGLNLNSMYGALISPRQFENDPYWNMEGLRGKDVYVSASTGMWTGGDWNLPLWDRIVGWGLEAVSRSTTVSWERKAREIGLNPTVDYPPTGIHRWGIWTDQMHKTKGRVLDVMNAW